MGIHRSTESGQTNPIQVGSTAYPSECPNRNAYSTVRNLIWYSHVRKNIFQQGNLLVSQRPGINGGTGECKAGLSVRSDTASDYKERAPVPHNYPVHRTATCGYCKATSTGPNMDQPEE